MSFRKSLQIPAIASLSSPQFDANPFLPDSDDVPGLSALIRLDGASRRWRRARGYGNLPDIRIKFCPMISLR
jgi:hypothetical protein